MNEPFDAEIRRSAKQSAEKSLQGWEFTPAMQQRVLDRIRAEEAGAVSTKSPARTWNPNKIVRPLAWTAVAAAALMMAVNMDIGGFGSQKQEAPQMEVASSPAPALMDTQQNDGKTAMKAQPGPAESAPVESGPTFGIAAANAPAQRVELALPEAPRAKDEPVMGIAAVAPDKYDLQASPDGRRVIELSVTAASALDAEGAPVWTHELEGVTEQSSLAVAADGRVAVTLGRKVKILSKDGKLERTVDLRHDASSVTWSKDGRLAVAQEPSVSVFKASELQFGASDVTEADLAFGPDGSLAVVGQQQGVRQVSLYDQRGAQLMKAPAPEGDGLAFGADGNVILAGAQAYDRSGNPLWTAHIPVYGVVQLGGGETLAVWNSGAVAALRAADGSAIWEAIWSSPGDGIRSVVTSPDGRYLAIVAAAEEGWALWVLDQSGTMLLQERLSSQPVDVAFAGGRLHLLMPQGVQVRVVPQ